MMRNRTWHDYLYEKILKVVDPTYKEVDYDWNKEMIKPKKIIRKEGKNMK